MLCDGNGRENGWKEKSGQEDLSWTQALEISIRMTPLDQDLKNIDLLPSGHINRQADVITL